MTDMLGRLRQAQAYYDQSLPPNGGGVIPPVPPANNVVTEAAWGFEDGTVAGWTDDLGNTLANSTAHAASGTHSLAVTSVSPSGAFVTQVFVGAAPGNYRLSYKGYTTIPDGTLESEIEWQDATHNWTGNITPSVVLDMLPDRWGTYIADVTAPANTAEAWIKLNIHFGASPAGSIIYIDEIALVPVP